MLEYAYSTRKYRLAASIAMLSEFGWCDDLFSESDTLIIERAKEIMTKKKLTSKARASHTTPRNADTPPSNAEPQKIQQHRFNKPTVEQVAAYCRERGNSVNAQQFVDFYEAKGWRIGPNSMKDWKAAVRTWEQRDQHDNRRDRRGATPPPHEQLNLSF